MIMMIMISTYLNHQANLRSPFAFCRKKNNFRMSETFVYFVTQSAFYERSKPTAGKFTGHQATDEQE
jgi:hypothetical protein